MPFDNPAQVCYEKCSHGETCMGIGKIMGDVHSPKPGEGRRHADWCKHMLATLPEGHPWRRQFVIVQALDGGSDADRQRATYLRKKFWLNWHVDKRSAETTAELDMQRTCPTCRTVLSAFDHLGREYCSSACRQKAYRMRKA